MYRNTEDELPSCDLERYITGYIMWLFSYCRRLKKSIRSHCHVPHWLCRIDENGRWIIGGSCSCVHLQLLHAAIAPPGLFTLLSSIHWSCAAIWAEGRKHVRVTNVHLLPLTYLHGLIVPHKAHEPYEHYMTNVFDPPPLWGNDIF